MNVFSRRSSHLSKRCTCQVLDHACAGLLREVSKRGCKATFATSIESLDKDADTIEDVDLAGFLSKKNHKMQQQTGSSLTSPKSISNIQQDHQSADNHSNKANSRGVQMDSKDTRSILSEIPVTAKTGNSDYWKMFVRVLAPGRGSQISHKLKATSPKHVQLPVTLTNHKGNEDDDFAELDSPSINLESENLATALDKMWSTTKKEQHSAVSSAKLTGDSFQKVSDSGFYRKNIAAGEQFVNKRDSRNNLGRRFDSAQRPGLKFVKEDDLGGKEKKEVVRKQKPINEVKESNTINGRSVCIEYVPRGISLHDIRKALSVYGEIVGCFLRSGNNGMVGCHLEYKTNEAKERALSDRWVVVNGKQLSVCRVDFPVTTTVRIACLGSKTSVYEIHSVCTSVGQMKSLQTREDGSVDVTFSVSESRIMPRILEKLNEVTLNDSRWIAQPAPRLSQCLAETPEGQSWVGEQLSNRISNLKKQLQLKRIYLEDMEELHNAIMHVKECPNLVNNEAFDTM